MTGMRFGNVELAYLQKQAVAEAKQQIAQQQQLMRDTTNQNVAPRQVTEARNRYSEAVKQILLNLHVRLGVSTPNP
jgi:ABC-type transport system involved in cytochrome bd biosynthesis fused ATPase/permease subunit